MSSTSWKSYGGIYKTHKINNLGVGTIVTDRIIVRKQNVAVQTIEDNVIIEGYQDTRGNVLATQNHVAASSVFAGNSVFVDNRILFINNLVNAGEVAGAVIFNDSAEPVTNLVTKYQDTYNYIGGNTTSIGIGTDTPRNFLEIYENDDIVQPAQQNTEVTMLSVRSHRNKTNSVLVSNNDSLYSAGLKARADGNNSSLEFHASDLSSNGNSIATLQNAGSNFKIHNDLSYGNIYIDALTIHLQSDGTTKIDLSNNVNISTQLTISNDISNTFLSEYYVDASSSYQTSNALVLNGNDASSNVFQHYVNSKQKGLSIGGGGFMENNTLSVGTLGLFTDNNSSSDSSFVPTMTICESNASKVKNRTTLGINTYSPNTNDYSLDINGKTRIGHGEIHVRAKPQFVINSMSFSKEDLNYGIAVGKIVTDPNSLLDLSYAAFVTEDGGENWTRKEVVGDGTIKGDNDNILTVHASGSSYAYVSVERPSRTNDILLYSTDKGTNWTTVLITTNILYRNISGYFDDISHNLFVSSPNNDNELYYYTLGSNANVFSNDVSGNYSTNHFIEHIVGLENNVVYSIGQHTTDASGVIGKYVFDDSVGGGVATYEKAFTGPTTFNRIYAYNENNVVAVGNDYIAYTNNGGSSDGSGWNLLSNTGFNLHDVYLPSSQYGIAIGNGVIVYSDNYYATWQEVSPSVLNASGMRTRLLNNLDTNSRLTMSSMQSILISQVIGNTSSDIIYNYFPTLFNQDHNMIDVSGSIIVSGTVTCGTITTTGSAAGGLSLDTFTANTINSGQTIQF